MRKLIVSALILAGLAAGCYPAATPAPQGHKGHTKAEQQYCFIEECIVDGHVYHMGDPIKR